MKQVRECPECGRYNPKRREACECGCRLGNVPIIEVEEDLNENPDFGLIVQPQDDTQEAFLDGQRNQYECSVCGAKYYIERFDEVQRCKDCRHIVYDPLERNCERKEAPQSLQNPVPAECGNRTCVVAASETLHFVSVAGKGSFSIEFDCEYKSFGRNSCNVDYICSNNYISREHFIYFLKDGKAFVVDTSANGTFINGIRLKKGETYPLENGDRLKVYNEEFIVEYGN